MLLTHRKLLQSKAIAIENDLRGTLRNFGLKVGVVGTVKFEARIKKLVEHLPDLAELVEPLLMVRRTLREQIGILHRRLLAVVRNDEVCRRLMTVPGVGPVVALTYRATVDVPARFRNSKAVGAVFGLTPSRYQSGEIRPSFQSDPFEAVDWVPQNLQQSFRLAHHLHFPHDPASVIHNADTGLLDRYIQSSKMVHAALLLLMLEAVNHGPRFTISLKRSTQKSSAIHKLGRPITPSLGRAPYP